MFRTQYSLFLEKARNSAWPLGWALAGAFAAALCLCGSARAESTTSTLVGIFERGGAMKALRPDRLANPLIAGAVLEAEWANLEPQEGVRDWTYLERSVALLAIAGKRAVLVVGGACPSWLAGQEPGAQPEPIETAWRRFVLALGQRFADSPNIAMAALSAPGLPRAQWPIGVEANSSQTSETVRLAPVSPRASAALFAQAFPNLPLALYAQLPGGPDAPEAIRVALEELSNSARPLAVVVLAEIHGEEPVLESLRPVGETMRAAHGRIRCGIRLARHTPESAAEEQPTAQTEGSENGAEPPADQFRRAIAFGLWLGASLFEIDAADSANFATRADLLYLHTQLSRIYGLSTPFHKFGDVF